jgi:hypothetical protein
MNPPEGNKARTGIILEVEFTRKEHDLLILAARRDKRTPQDQVRWYAENYGLGKLPFTEEGAEARSLLRGTVSEVRYSDNVSVETSPAFDKE